METVLQSQLAALQSYAAATSVAFSSLRATLTESASLLHQSDSSGRPAKELLDLLSIAPLAPHEVPTAAHAALAYLESQGRLPPTAYVSEGTATGKVPGHIVHRKLGQGCFSEVFLAQQLDPWRKVALKLHRPPFAPTKPGDVPFRGILNEMRFQAAAEGHSTVSLLRCGLTAGAAPYLGFEYMPHGTLAQEVRRLSATNDPTADSALALADRVLMAAAKVHGANIVHGDMSVSNFLVGAEGEIKLSDFALARRLNEPPYLFEILGRKRKDPEGLAYDVFQLGKVLYQIFTRHPEDISDQSLLKDSLPSRKRPDLEIPSWIDDLVARSITPNPDERFPDALSMQVFVASHRSS